MKVHLKDIASFSKGQQINGSDLIPDGKYDFLNGGINPSGRWSDYNVRGGTVTISEGGNSCGYVNYMPDNFWCGAHCYYLYNEKVPSKYLYYLLKSQQDSIMRLRSGACMPNIKTTALSELEINVDFQADVQRRVVENLDRISDLIALRKRQLTKLDELVKSRFVELFENANYPECRLSDVCEKITDGTHKTPEYQPNGITFVSAKNIVNGKLDFSDVKYITEAEYQDIQKRCQTERGDVLMSKSGSLGMVAMVETGEKLGLFESLAVLKYKRDRLNGVFLKEQLRSETVQRKLLAGVKGITIKHLHLNVISETPIVVPPLAIQERFAAFVRRSDKSKFTIQRSLDKLEALKKALMQEYFG